MEIRTDPGDFFSLKSVKHVRSEAKIFEKNIKALRKRTTQLFDKLTKAFDRETRPEVRQVYFYYLEELRILMNLQEELREKWLSRLDLFKNLVTNGDVHLRFQIWLWLLRYEFLNVVTVETVERDEIALRHGNTELQFLVMNMSCKMTILMISILKRQLKTTSHFLDYLPAREYRSHTEFVIDDLVEFMDAQGFTVDVIEPHGDRDLQAINELAGRLAAQGNGAADAEAIKNLEEGIKNLSCLYKYISAEREKRLKYLPNLVVDDSNLLADSLFTGMELKMKDLNKYAKLALNKELSGNEKFEYIYLNDTYRIELDHITDMLELAGYMVRRAVLFPILEQKEVSRKICSVCLKEEDRHFWLCAACVGVTYCGPECQELDWPQHQVICGPSRLDNVKRKQRIEFQTINTEKEIQVRCRVNQFYNNS